MGNFTLTSLLAAASTLPAYFEQHPTGALMFLALVGVVGWTLVGMNKK